MFYQSNHFGFSDYVKVEKNKNFSFPPHLHQCFEIIYLNEGTMEVTLNDKSFILKKGEAIFIFPHQIHELKSVESEHTLSIFSPKLVKAFEAKVIDKIPVDNKFVPDKYLIHLFENLDKMSFIDQKGVLYLMCGQFDKDREYLARKSDKASLLTKIFSFVESEFKEDCSLKNLAASIGYDYAYLSSYFKKTVGISFNEYVIYVRLSHACYSLKNSSLPIVQCAYDSGFTSLRTFNRNFKECYGVTPAEFRAK